MTKKIERQPIWESSIRPLYPKCVWVEGTGYRNFIIDHNIHKRRTSYQNTSSISLGGGSVTSVRSFGNKSVSCDVIDEDELTDLQLIGSSDLQRFRRASNLSDDVSTTTAGRTQCRRHLQNTSKSSNFSAIKRQLNKRFPHSRSGGDKNPQTTSASDLTDGTEQTPFECCENAPSAKDIEHLNASKSLLTERVLQWLDLAGRNTIIRPECELAKKLPPRRICTTDSLKKPIVTQTAPLKRTESLHHLSLTFNEDETYVAAQPPTDRDKAALSFGEFFPTTYRSSRAFLAGRLSAHHHQQQHPQARPPSAIASIPEPNLGHSNTQQQNNDHTDADDDDVVENDDEHDTSQTTQPSASKTSGKSKKNEKNIENQYRALIQRQILEKSCNTQIAKRQLHIFMPNLPKKKPIATATGGISGVAAAAACLADRGHDYDSSCLSTIMSNISK